MWKKIFNLSIAICLILFGLWAFMNGVSAAQTWAALSLGTQIYYGVALVAGAAAFFTGAWLLIRRKLMPPIWVGAPIAFAVLAVNQLAGVTLDTIPCYSPG
ncbi:MAG: hypothetical protein ACRD8O_22835 [Bryobacteraceae bacterium]